MGEPDWQPETYLAEIREVIPRYDELQDQVAAATRALDVREALELGTGTGETARRILALHAEVHLIAVDGNAAMLGWAGDSLPQDRVELKLMRLEDAPPAGRFGLVFSVLAVHHLPSAEKAALFSRIAAVLRPGGPSAGESGTTTSPRTKRLDRARGGCRSARPSRGSDRVAQESRARSRGRVGVEGLGRADR